MSDNLNKRVENFSNGFFALNNDGVHFTNNSEMKKYIKQKEKEGYTCFIVNILKTNPISWKVVISKN